MGIYAGDVGLGDALKHVTSAVGLKPCDGCERRAAALNRWVVFSAGRPDDRLKEKQCFEKPKGKKQSV
jgi:hypothetical protein